MSIAADLESFFASGKEVIVSEPLKFKAKLGIGARAYALIRARENLSTFIDALSIGVTASGIAGSSTVATAFFGKAGVVARAFSMVGMGSVASTPIGWVIGAGIVSGVAYLGVAKVFERSKDHGVVVVPKYINTPLDIIAMALMELMLPVSLKIAKTDAGLQATELEAIREFFVDEWGYSPTFVEKMVEEYAEHLDAVSFSKLAASLHTYCKDSPDCDQDKIVDDFIKHLREIIEADGVITHEEKMKLDYISEILVIPEQPGMLPNIWGSAVSGLSKGLKTATGTAKSASGRSFSGLKKTASVLGSSASEASNHASQYRRRGLDATKASLINYSFRS